MKQLTASSCYISLPEPLAETPVLGCQWWRRDDVLWEKDPPGSPAELGIAFHDLAESHALGENVDFSKYANQSWFTSLQRRYANWLEWWAELPLTTSATAHVEVPLRLEVDTGESRIILGQKTRRDYSMLDPTREIGGTADLIVHCPSWDIPLHVYDYKTGEQPVPASSTQMVVLGLMAAKVFKANRVNLVVVTVHEDGVWEDQYELTPKLLVALKAVQAAFHQDANTPVPGPWCRWCPARSKCPSVAEALSAIPPAATERYRLSTTVSSPEHASWLVQTLPLAEEFVEKIRDTLKAYSDETGGIPLSDGSVWSGKEQNDIAPSMTGPAVSWLRKQPGGDKAMRRYCTWKTIEEACGKKPAADIRDHFIANGWVSERTKRVYRSRKGKKK